ncbi:hypothetical protein [Streptomyces zingiberis]|uniref:Uncharacterized protein n=1 Tax=Streptomyces zingiberis TaxID=2053010 RepID=A0ABX1BUG2_9ACTN|nr:hypothetical protein [Streptomyces zingiberis]NJQ01364.1 hypothetical protein [Streptomyces zingiberis]
MAGFRSLAEQVRDPGLTPEQRRTALRRCLEKFAPYGHRATWHHLCGRVGIPTGDRRPEPERLVRALAELEEARRVWLAYEMDFGAHRKREKRLGIRQPGALHDWHRRTWGGCGVAWCDDPAVHPDAPLAEVLRRMIQALESEPGSVCPVCRSPRLAWRGGLDHVPSSAPVCADCGIVVPEPVLTEGALATAHRPLRAALATAS